MVDDLLAIGIIAIFYTDEIQILPLGIAFAVIVIYGFIAQRYRAFFGLRPFAAWTILLPIGVVAWAFMHASGVHATIAGVLLGFTIPVLHKRLTSDASKARKGLAEEFEHRFRPLSAGFAVPSIRILRRRRVRRRLGGTSDGDDRPCHSRNHRCPRPR